MKIDLIFKNLLFETFPKLSWNINFFDYYIYITKNTFILIQSNIERSNKMGNIIFIDIKERNFFELP